MSLAGTRIGPYDIVAPLGAGGMGEVYRARDTKLGRDVAIKILPASFASDPERLARFEREARVLASLNHPHIAQIYGLEGLDGEDGRDTSRLPFIVMELVEGETLAQKLEGIRDKGLAIGQALSLARQIADALDAAHERGIVHRDLKPANIVITPDGMVKMLDFGLAKPVAAVAGQAGRAGGEELTNSPTMMGPTLDGVLLGTAPYMSPEQARGKAVDKRTDIWAFGCVLYEMLTGYRAFSGETTTDVLAGIVEREPDFTKLPSATPMQLVRLLRRCLDKDMRRRLRDIGDFQADADDAPPVERRPARWRQAVMMVACAVAGALLTWTAARWKPIAATSPLAAVKLTPLTNDAGYEGDPTFAPDGETIAYVSDRTGNFEIFLKQASGGRDINLTNDDGDDIQPAFSPDGRQIAFVSSRGGGAILPYGTDNPLMGGDIWVMPALGGSPRRIAEKGNFPSWSPDGSRILYVSGSWFGKKLFSVPAAGGAPEEIPVKMAVTNLLMSSSYSPDGRWILFDATPARIYVVSASGGEPVFIARGRHPIWGADGQIVYSNDESGRNFSLWEAAFSPGRAAAAGSAHPLTVSRGRDLPGSVSRDGRRIAFTFEEQSSNLEIMPFDAETGKTFGRPEPLTSGMQAIYFWSFSPDGQSVVFDTRRGAGSTIWRVTRGSAPVALTGDSAFDDRGPRWSPDGKYIAFNRTRASAPQTGDSVWLMTADGGSPRSIVEGSSELWLPDGQAFVYFRAGQLHRYDLASKQSRALTNEPHVMPIAAVSPDGRWLVYQSTAAGNVDLRAVAIDGGPSRVIVATSGEDYHPFFSPSGRWLYFEPNHKNIARVPGPAQEWRTAAPETVTHFPESALSLEDPQVSPDGRQLGFSRIRTRGDVWILTR